jgi:STE24 endopeptidase
VPVRRVLLGLAIVATAAAWLYGFIQLWQTTVPGDLTLPDLDPHRYFTQAQLDEASSYQTFLRIDELLALIAQVVALGIFAIKGPAFVRESAAGRIGTGMLLGMLALAFVWLSQFPFGLAELWWDRRHDVSSQDYLTWIINDFLAAGGEFLFICLALLIVMALAGVWRRYWWIAAAPALVAVITAYAFLQPYLTPDKHPLRYPRIAADAERLAAKEGIPDTAVRVQNTRDLGGSPNAAAAGFGPSRRVILWDTLLEHFPRAEIRVVLAHEFAHLERGHLLKMFGGMAMLALPIAFIVAVVTRRRGGLYEPAAVPLAVFVVMAIVFVLLPMQTAFTRTLETEADWKALETTRDPAAMTGGFRRLARLSLAQPDPPAWDYFLFQDHPSIMQRIEMAQAWKERNAGGLDWGG